MDDQIITFGKYQGLTFEQLIEHDINYALWLTTLQTTNQRNEDLVNYLKQKKRSIIEKINERSLKKIKILNSNV